jgi:hypothetical protein
VTGSLHREEPTRRAPKDPPIPQGAVPYNLYDCIFVLHGLSLMYYM